ncbi:unnamed protein product, partial [marine sediment metagenome]
HEKLTAEAGESCAGKVDFAEQVVYVAHDYTPERVVLIFCHELAHLLLDAAGVSTPEQEEWAERLERPLASLLAENSWQQK